MEGISGTGAQPNMFTAQLTAACCRPLQNPRRLAHARYKPRVKDYGEKCQKRDMNLITFEEAKREFLLSRQKTDVESSMLEEETGYQGECNEWLKS